jgi:16S rRNA (adenine1518-N6/adenine1519-N6)-dimethyltransferase
MFELATMAFQRKRKTLSNGLAMGLDRPKAEMDGTLVAIGIDPMRRPQTLTVDEWLAIAKAIPA